MTGRNRVKHFRYAQASAAEACAVLDLVHIDGSHAIQQQLRRIGAMANKLE